MIIIYSTQKFISNSWAVREISPDPGGLPARYILKSMIPLGFILLIIQGIAEAGKCLMTIAGYEKGGKKLMAFIHEYMPLIMFTAVFALLAFWGILCAFTIGGVALFFGLWGFGPSFFELMPLRIWGTMNQFHPHGCPFVHLYGGDA